MSDKEKVLCFLRDNSGQTIKTRIIIDLFRSGRSQSELNDLLTSVLAGLVTVRRKKNKEIWKLTPAGWSAVNQIVPEKPAETLTEAISDDFQRFKDLAKNNPDCSPQRLLQLAGRHLGDPFEWGFEWQQAHPDWFLQQPRDWYARDVELDADGYPSRLPESPLTGKDREVRPNSERSWFEFAVRCPGASLEPLAVEMPAFEVANVIRVTRKIGMENATEIFGPEKLATAYRLASLTVG